MRLAGLFLGIAASSLAQAQSAPAPAPADRRSEAMHIDHGDMAAPKTPMLMEGYGTGGFPITTRSPKAQAFFNNGMQLAHAFAHQAAIEAMGEAVRLDPDCAMCLWGLAWVSGPTINFTKKPAEIEELADKVSKAASLAKKAGTDRERGLIEALRLRYQDGGGRKPGDLRFAKAMTALAGQYPDDDEIAVIAADAWLDSPGDGHEDDVLNASMAMPLLEKVLARHPDDTGAIHFYIHATEQAEVAGKAERYADRLAMLAPNASHLVHMPSHTYYWIGRYQDAATANWRAVQIGIETAKRLNLPPPDGVWGLPYHSHNVIFGLGGALMANDKTIGLGLGRPLVLRAQTRESTPAGGQLLSALGYEAMARFADPAEVLALPQPKLPYLVTAWQYARGEALARKGDAAGVRKEAAAIRGVPTTFDDDDGDIAAQQMTFIARNVLNGRAAMMDGHFDEAATAFRQASELQETTKFSNFSDPPAWYYPVRRDLAAALLAKGDMAGARSEAIAALAYRPKDPGSLIILQKAGPQSASR